VSIARSDEVRVAVSGSSWTAWTGTSFPRPAAPIGQLDEYDGQFGVISYDADAGSVLVANDPFGMQCLYVAERGERTFVSTSALALAKHLRSRPSRFGLATLACAGYHFGTTTNWEGIERLDPGTALVFSRATRERRSYWRPSIDEDVARLTGDELVEHYVGLSSKLFGRYSQLAPWSDLTGGFDSRLLNLLLDRAGLELRRCTRGDEGADEVRVAREVARRAGWEWVLFSLPRDWGKAVRALLPLALSWGDAQRSVLDIARPLWKHSQTSQTNSFLIGGGGGEPLKDFAWQQEFPRAGRTNHVNMDRWVNMRLLRKPDGSIFAENPVPAIQSDFRRRMAEWTAPYKDRPNVVQLDLMDTYQSTGGFGIQGSAAAVFLDRILPFYSKALFVSAISADYRQRRFHRLMRRMTHRLSPAVAAVEARPWGGPVAPVTFRNAHRFIPYYLDIAKRGSKKLGVPIGRRPPVDARTVEAREALLSHAEEVCGGRLRAGDFRSAPLFRREALENLLQEARSPAFSNDRLLGRVLTVELALRAADSALE
jgi:hypothetical protein